MKLNQYNQLICNLPVRQQSFTTKRKTWQKAENEIDWLKGMNNNLFDAKTSLTLSRQDIFDTSDLREAIIKTIYWGYPRGMRGNNFIKILKSIDLIESTFNNLKQTNRPTTEYYNKLINTLKEVKGLGLSTYSKFLYFLNITFNESPSLILDKRLIDVFARNTFPEFDSIKSINFYNKEKKYLDFIQLINRISKEIETKGENIEQFLFIFGNNLNDPINSFQEGDEIEKYISEI